MKHKIIPIMAALVWGLCFSALPAQAKYGGGSGEPNDPYLIYDENQMNSIGANPADWNKCFKLMSDIDLSGFTGTSFNIIGKYVGWQDANNKPFAGVFDGNNHTISNFSYTFTVTDYIGLFGYVSGENAEIKNLGLIDPNVDAGTRECVSALVGWLYDGKITDCYVEGGSVTGDFVVGGLVGWNWSGTITNGYSSNRVLGTSGVGGLVGINYEGTITNCYSSAAVSGGSNVGGLVGRNYGTITNCYSEGNVSGDERVGGLVGRNGYPGVPPPPTLPMNRIKGQMSDVSIAESTATFQNNNDVSIMGGHASLYELDSHIGIITNCYSRGRVKGTSGVGGLVGYNYGGTISNSFWDIETSGQTTSAGGTGKTTAEMQMASTFTDAGWDFNTPVWIIEEGVDYPRLWWELVPVLHSEPEVTSGTSNIISWEPIIGDVEYYAECAEDENFTSIIYNSGWITETSCEFTGLELGKRYWYSVKAINAAGVESQWSNVESSLQCTLADAVDIELAPESLKNENLKNALLNKINEALQMIDEGLYKNALNKLENDILQKTNGCSETGQPDKNDWIVTCEEQSKVYPLVIETIEHIRSLIQ